MTKCINCNSNNLKKIVKLGKQPLSGKFLKKKIYQYKRYSLDLVRCEKCKLVQLEKVINASLMFGDDYEYSTSLSNLMKDHIKEKIIYLKKKKYLKNNSTILDIGCNDGFFLNSLKNQKKLFGIDPSAKKFQKNYKKDINLICDFFSKKNIDKFEKKIHFDLITSFAMFYDVSKPNLFCKDINQLLTNDGLWMLELSYLPLMLKNLTYDQICHEHIAYYSLSTFNNIIKKNKLKIIDVRLNEINGGSIEIICSKKNSFHKVNSKKIKSILKDEKKIKYESFVRFGERINKLKKIFQLFINLNSKKKIIGYGASTKGNIVLNHCKINNKQIEQICDGSKRKVGRYTPGTNIKIISKKKMRLIKPDYLIIFIWSFRKEVIVQELDFLFKGGKLIFLLPKFHIVTKFNYKEYLKNNFKEMAYDY